MEAAHSSFLRTTSCAGLPSCSGIGMMRLSTLQRRYACAGEISSRVSSQKEGE